MLEENIEFRLASKLFGFNVVTMKDDVIQEVVGILSKVRDAGYYTHISKKYKAWYQEDNSGILRELQYKDQIQVFNGDKMHYDPKNLDKNFVQIAGLSYKY